MADGTYATHEVASLVEELLAKGYDQMKGRLLTTLEAVLDKKNLGKEPVGRLLVYGLDDAHRVMMDIVAKHMPEITPAHLEEAARQRYQAASEATLWASEQRQDQLKLELNDVERVIRAKEYERLKSDVQRSVEYADMALLQRMQEARVRTHQCESIGGGADIPSQ
jgi:hypothetical protein